jgi:hypothetical protein
MPYVGVRTAHPNLAQLGGLAPQKRANPLILNEGTPEGLHYTGVAVWACAAVILGGG